MTLPGAPQPGPHATDNLSRRAAGWAVHALTGSGAVIGLMAMLAVIRGDARAALLWLGAALAVDALDGPIARKLRVREVLPKVDGAVLDLVVDYLTYVLVPAVFVYWFDLLPPGWGLPGAGFILLTSLYCFANVEMKTSDNYFSGFPAIWNVVVLYLWVLATPAWVNALVVVVLGILTFVPVKFVHPVRVREARAVTYGSVVAWTLCTLGLIASSPDRPVWLLAPWLAASLWLAYVSLRRTIRGVASE
jgi:phosphatidylcholine synthase